jgi:hypothetical protein
VASAAGPTSDALLLQYLTTTGWVVDVRSHAGGEVNAVAERGEERLVAWARTRQAAAVVLFEHACGSPSFGGEG